MITDLCSSYLHFTNSKILIPYFRQPMKVRLSFESAEQYAQFMRDIAPPINLQLKNISEDQVNRAWNAVTEVVRNYEKDGNIIFDNEITLITATHDTN